MGIPPALEEKGNKTERREQGREGQAREGRGETEEGRKERLSWTRKPRNLRTLKPACPSSIGKGYNYFFIHFLMSLLKQSNNNNRIRHRLISTLIY